MGTKQLFSVAATILTFVTYVPYVRGITRGVIKPHIFTWTIWGFCTVVVFLAQRQGGAGVGSWAIGFSACIAFYIAWLSSRSGILLEANRTDWVFLVVSLSVLPAWLFTNDAIYAVIILTAVDLAGFGPTFRSAYIFPFREHLTFFVLGAIRNVLVIVAVEHYSVTTILFPAAGTVACVALAALIAYRRTQVQR
jgi:hypothetical protein